MAAKAGLWPGAKLWFPEIDQGFGLSTTLGVAGFTSAAACKVGARHAPCAVAVVHDHGPICERLGEAEILLDEENLSSPRA
jgi:hypothetical protein